MGLRMGGAESDTPDRSTREESYSVHERCYDYSTKEVSSIYTYQGAREKSKRSLRRYVDTFLEE